MMGKWRVVGRVACLLMLVTSQPTAWAGSNDTSGTDGPSLEETLSFIKDTWEACATMHNGSQRMTPKDGTPWQIDRIAKVDVVVLPPSILQIVTRLNERLRFTGALDLQAPVERIQEFDLKTMSPTVSPEREGESGNLYLVRLRCTRAACVTEWVANLVVPGKPMHDLKTGKLTVTNLDELVYEDRAPKDKPGEKKGEVHIPVCDSAALESLSKALNHAITKAGGKKPLF